VSTRAIWKAPEHPQNAGIQHIVYNGRSNEIAQLFWSKIGFEKVDFIETYGMNIE
jgi:hypothetical protein